MVCLHTNCVQEHQYIYNNDNLNELENGSDDDSNYNVALQPIATKKTPKTRTKTNINKHNQTDSNYENQTYCEFVQTSSLDEI